MTTSTEAMPFSACEVAVNRCPGMESIRTPRCLVMEDGTSREERFQ